LASTVPAKSLETSFRALFDIRESQTVEAASVPWASHKESSGLEEAHHLNVVSAFSLTQRNCWYYPNGVTPDSHFAGVHGRSVRYIGRQVRAQASNMMMTQSR